MSIGDAIGSFGDALGMLWERIGDAFGTHLGCFGDALGTNWGRIGALVMQIGGAYRLEDFSVLLRILATFWLFGNTFGLF